VASVLPTFAARGQRKPALIDTHLHFYPPEYQKLWLDYEDARKQPHFPGQVAWTRSKLIEDMRYDVTTGSTISSPGYGAASYPAKVIDGKISVAVLGRVTGCLPIELIK
jgi:hypothetical protein